MLNARHVFPLFPALAFLLVCPADAFAQSYPTRPIRLIVPVAPGGGVDFTARLVGAKLGDSLGQTVVIDNRPGAGNVIGTELAARATPDGYTLTMGNNSSHGVNQAVRRKLPYDTIKDFTPITLISSAPHLLVTGNSVPANTIREFVELVKSRPGQFNIGSAGTATQTHLSAELFKFVTGIKMTHIPYKGTGPAFTAMMGGEIHLLFSSTAGSMVHVKAGRIKALGITGEKRSKLVPHIATLAEQGVPRFESGPWYALLGPAGMPAPIVARLNREVVKIVNTAEIRQKLERVGAEPVGSTPEACAQVIKDELEKWRRVLKDTGIRLD